MISVIRFEEARLPVENTQMRTPGQFNITCRQRASRTTKKRLRKKNREEERRR
jgi:hypothetical protein